MNNFIVKFCKQNNIGVFYNNNGFQVIHLDKVLYQSKRYSECIDFILELIIYEKYSIKDNGGKYNDWIYK